MHYDPREAPRAHQAGVGAVQNTNPVGPTSVSEHLSYIRDDVFELLGRLSNIADRVSGSVPHPATEVDAKDAPVPTLHRCASQIKSALSSIRDVVNRLENTL